MDNKIKLPQDIVEVDYEQLYLNEKMQKLEIAEKLEEKSKELKKLLKKFTTISSNLEEANKKILSYVNSNTAKEGYKEEYLICTNINNNSKIKSLIIELTGKDCYKCFCVNGSHKIDIKSENDIFKAQVKKFKKNQFQQLDRHWVCDLVKFIPGLKPIELILKNMCEYPILPDGINIDKSKSLKKLCSDEYSEDILIMITDILNKYKIEILEYIFLGKNIEFSPEYLIGVEYIELKRHKIVFLKIEDIIIYLKTLQFKINKSKTVIALGADNIISLQRKGGDGGKKSGNQLQFKIIVSKLLDHVKHLNYDL